MFVVSVIFIGCSGVFFIFGDVVDIGSIVSNIVVGIIIIIVIFVIVVIN